MNFNVIANIMEIGMLICFGLSWPINAFKSYKAKTTKGKSLPFLILIFTGYIFGIAGKIFIPTTWYVMMFYILNICMVSLDIILYFRNLKIDKDTAKKLEKEKNTENLPK